MDVWRRSSKSTSIRSTMSTPWTMTWPCWSWPPPCVTPAPSSPSASRTTPISSARGHGASSPAGAPLRREVLAPPRSRWQSGSYPNSCFSFQAQVQIYKHLEPGEVARLCSIPFPCATFMHSISKWIHLDQGHTALEQLKIRLFWEGLETRILEFSIALQSYTKSWQARVF